MCSIMDSYWSLSVTIASSMPYILYSALCGIYAAQEIAQALSMRPFGVDEGGVDDYPMLLQCRQHGMVQTIPRSQPHAVSTKGF